MESLNQDSEEHRFALDLETESVLNLIHYNQSARRTDVSGNYGSRNVIDQHRQAADGTKDLKEPDQKNKDGQGGEDLVAAQPDRGKTAED